MFNKSIYTQANKCVMLQFLNHFVDGNLTSIRSVVKKKQLLQIREWKDYFCLKKLKKSWV